MPTMYRRERLRDRARHISTVESTGPWTMPSPRRYAACESGPCAQGRKVCPSPDACQRPLFDDSPIASRVIGFALFLGGVAVLFAVFWP